MSRERLGRLIGYAVCIALTVLAFFAKELVLYDFHMSPSDYDYRESDAARPAAATGALWFSLDDGGRALLCGQSADASGRRFFALTEAGVTELASFSAPDASALGFFAATLPARELDANGDGRTETVYDSARADIGPRAYELGDRAFRSAELPFELAFAERKYLQVWYRGQPLTHANVTVTVRDGTTRAYETDGNGLIAALPVGDARGGVTVAYSPSGDSVYRMYYLIEDYGYFTAHFWQAYLPLAVVLLLTAVCVLLVWGTRELMARRDPARAIYARERPGLRPGYASPAMNLLPLRWALLTLSFLFWSYAGKPLRQGQLLNQIAVPVFSCPFNLDQVLESSCYYFTHLSVLFTTRSWAYILAFLATLGFCLLFLGRVLCGFACPLGFVQDLLDRLRQALHIRAIPVSDRMNRALQPIKWVWIALFLCFGFTGGDFCDICPNKVFSPALGGYWVNLALGGFLSVALLTGSFFIRRFWCLLCPLGYLLGLAHRFNLFKLRKDCEACTECGACYEACPMRLKIVYTERNTARVQTTDCLMCGECVHNCPEDNALALTFCGRTIYRASRAKFLGRYAPRRAGKSASAAKHGGERRRAL